MPAPASVAVSIATRSGLSPAAITALARAGERAGLAELYLAESGSDALALSQAVLTATDSLIVGTAIANARLRHPSATAMATALLDELSGGRFRLGLGVSSAAYNESVLGLPPVRPVPFMRDYVAALRRTWGLGEPAVPVDRPARTALLPVTLAAMQPRMLRLAGEIADGVVLALTSPATLPALLAEVAAGAHGAGRPATAVRKACVLPCCFDADPRRAILAGRNVVLGYARHPGAARMFAERGLAGQLPEIVAALDRGDADQAARLLDPAFVAEFVLLEPSAAADRVAAYADAGIDLPILFPVPAGGEWEAAVRTAIEVAAGLRCTSISSDEGATNDGDRSNRTASAQP